MTSSIKFNRSIFAFLEQAKNIPVLPNLVYSSGHVQNDFL